MNISLSSVPTPLPNHIAPLKSLWHTVATMPKTAAAEQSSAKLSPKRFPLLNRNGRPKGSKNYLTRNRSVADLASPYGPEAIAKLVKLMRHSENEQTQAWAANALLDRAYGRPHQSVSSSSETVHYVVAMPELPATVDEWKKLAADSLSAKPEPQVIDQPTDHKD